MKVSEIRCSRQKVLLALVFVVWACSAFIPEAVAIDVSAEEKERFNNVLATYGYSKPAATDSGGEQEQPAMQQTDSKQAPLDERMQTIVSIDCEEMPIEQAIQMMTRDANIDIIKSPDVTGFVTATLTNVPLEEALTNILAAHGFGYVPDRSLLRIMPLKEIIEQPEPIVTKIYQITYADVEQVAAALEKFISKQGTVSLSKGTSHVIVSDVESRVKAVTKFVAEIDKVTPQILIEVRIYDITSRDTLDLGIDWMAGRNTTFTGGLGSNPTGQNGPFSTGTFAADTDKTASTFSGNLRFGYFSGGIDVDAILKARYEDVEAKLLANPRILVLDNEKAMFDIVTEEPYSEVTITNDSITENIKFKFVGVKLQVQPHVTRDKLVRMHIQPEFSVVVRNETFQTSTVPVVDKRTVDTVALVEDQHTVVLGGLRKKDVAKQINKIPLLGDLPLIGGLFRFEGENTENTEIVVFITPHIVINQPLMTASEQQAYRATEFEGPPVELTRAERKAEK